VLVDASGPSIPQMTEPEQTTVNVTELTFNWTESTDPESGVGNYTLVVDNNSDFSSPEFDAWVGNVTNFTVTGLVVDTTYFAKVRSQNVAGVDSSFSNTVSVVVDTTAPVITLSKPSGIVISSTVTIVLQTDETAVCSSRQDANSYTEFTFTNSTLHEIRVTYTGSSFDVKCVDSVNNQRVQALSFTVDASATVSTVTLQSQSVFTDEIVNTNVSVKTSGGVGIGEIGKSDFSVEVDSESLPFSLFDVGGGNYTLRFSSPGKNGSYSYEVTVKGVVGVSTLSVHLLLFIVQYVESGLSVNRRVNMIYSIAGNFSIGVASDSSGVSASSTDGGINLSANVRDGDVFVFVTRASGSVERVEELLKDKVFLDAVNPSFGYALDQDTFVVFTDLEYGDIALTGNATLETGKFNLIIKNLGFDSTLNKKKLEIRVT